MTWTARVLQGKYASVLAHYLDWHLRVGFSGLLLYEPYSMVQRLLAYHHVARMAAQGHLRFVVWDHQLSSIMTRVTHEG